MRKRRKIRFNPESIHPSFRERRDQRVVVRMIPCIFLRDRNGVLYVAYLNFNGKQWYLNFNRLDNDWDENDRFPRCNSLHSLPTTVGGVCFWGMLCIHLPSIFPLEVSF